MNRLIHNNLNSGIMGQAWSRMNLLNYVDQYIGLFLYCGQCIGLKIMEKQKTLVYTNEELSVHEQKEDNSAAQTCMPILQE